MKIIVRAGKYRQLYEASLEGLQVFGQGTSPDEALGHAIRELWLGCAFEGPVKLELVFETEGAAQLQGDRHGG
jgi:hypothetical protein